MTDLKRKENGNEFCRKSIPLPFQEKRKAIILFWVLLITETMILSTVTILRASEVARIELLGKSKAKIVDRTGKSGGIVYG